MFIKPSVVAGLITTLVAASPALAQTQAFKSAPAAVSKANHANDDPSGLFEDGRLDEARAAFERATRNARDQGTYGKEAFAGLASVQFALDDVKGAARTFDELGERAAAFGDPETEITAFFKSALLYAQAGDKRTASLHVPRLKKLLQSPVISDETRKMVAERIAK